ncbi:hypothetical protein KAX17_11065 [Candidatus Bipolaricaulota bacterium]|nr:hypothetical protein [Candidatus Bipolaricaulota bacterium]
MELWEFLLGGLVLIIIAVVLFARVFNTSIARWVSQVPQIAQGAVANVKLPRFKLMDVLGYGAMEILQDPEVKKQLAGTISGFLQGLGNKKGGPPVV